MFRLSEIKRERQNAPKKSWMPWRRRIEAFGRMLRGKKKAAECSVLLRFVNGFSACPNANWFLMCFGVRCYCSSFDGSTAGVTSWQIAEVHKLINLSHSKSFNDRRRGNFVRALTASLMIRKATWDSAGRFLFWFSRDEIRVTSLSSPFRLALQRTARDNDRKLCWCNRSSFSNRRASFIHLASR